MRDLVAFENDIGAGQHAKTKVVSFEVICSASKKILYTSLNHSR